MGYNVFADMGLPDPDTELIKCDIVRSLRGIIVEKGFTDEAVGALWGIPAAEVPPLLEGYWGRCSVEDLFRFADSLNHAV